MSERVDQDDVVEFSPQWDNARAFATPAAVPRLPEYAAWKGREPVIRLRKVDPPDEAA